MRANGKNATEGRLDFCQIHVRLPIFLKQKAHMRFGKENDTVSDYVRRAIEASTGDVVLDVAHLKAVDEEQTANYRKRMENRAKLDAQQSGLKTSGFKA